jgi:GNAT superfamily N-acetyltransferase
MIDPEVRVAGPDDAAALAPLEAAARSALLGTRGGDRWLDEHPEIGDGWTERISTGGVFVAVIRIEASSSGAPGAEVIVGYLVASLPPGPVPVVMIEQVYIDPDARELGFGEGLVAAAMEYGRRGGARLVEAHTLPGDRELKNLYERAGVTARLITVSRPL